MQIADISAWLGPLSFILDPEQRIFWGYLMASLLLAVAVLLFNSRNISGLKRQLRELFSASLWLNQSSWLDVQWATVNYLLRVALVVPILGASLALSLQVNRNLVAVLGEGNWVSPSPSIVAFMFSLCLFITDDFSRFFVHYLYHKLPWLWRFHAIHHSAPTLTPLTLYRVHSIEMIINSVRSFAVIGIVSGIFMYFIDGRIGAIELLGAMIFNALFHLAGSNLRHSPLWLGFGPFERFFISPAQHQIHHSVSPQHHDRNFGSALAIWDRLFGTWCASKGQEKIHFGLTGLENTQTLLTQIAGIKSSLRPNSD